MVGNVECTCTCRLSKFQTIFNYSATQKSNNINKYGKQSLTLFDILSKKLILRSFVDSHVIVTLIFYCICSTGIS